MCTWTSLTDTDALSLMRTYTSPQLQWQQEQHRVRLYVKKIRVQHARRHSWLEYEKWRDATPKSIESSGLADTYYISIDIARDERAFVLSLGSKISIRSQVCGARVSITMYRNLCADRNDGTASTKTRAWPIKVSKSLACTHARSLAVDVLVMCVCECVCVCEYEVLTLTVHISAPRARRERREREPDR